MNDRDLKSIKRVINHIESILDYVSTTHSFDEFNHQKMVIDAVVFNLSQIGEISKYRISSVVKETYDNIAWNEMYGFRNRIIHDYDQINMNIVYDTIINDLPVLLNQFSEIISNQNK